MKKNNKKGFTLVELVIVVAVMAVLVAVAIPTVSSITATAKGTVSDTNARTIESILKLADAEKNKNAAAATVLTPGEVDTAVTNAKLGIKDGTFLFNTDEGTVEPVDEGTTAANTKEIIIVFNSEAAAAADKIATSTYVAP